MTTTTIKHTETAGVYQPTDKRSRFAVVGAIATTFTPTGSDADTIATRLATTEGKAFVFDREFGNVTTYVRHVDEDELPTEGWGYPTSSARAKAHYYAPYAGDRLRTLCGKYGMFLDGERAQLEPDNGKPSSDDCAECRRKLDKRKGTA